MKYFLETKIPYIRNKVQFIEAKMFVLKAKINWICILSIVLLHSDQKFVSKFITLALTLYGHWLNLGTPIFQKGNFARIFWSKAYTSLLQKNIYPHHRTAALVQFLYQLGYTYIRDIIKTGELENIVDKTICAIRLYEYGFFSDQTIYICMY